MTVHQAVIIIPHYNDLARLTKCLTALAPQVAAHPEVELLVADNASTEDLAPVKAAFPEARFVTETAKGAAAARNCGVRESTAPLLFFTDADCVPEPDWLDRALALAGSADVIGGRVDTFDETPSPKSGAEAFETVFAFHQKHYVENRGFSVTANLLTSRAVFDQVGDFINGVPEDIEWCRRAVQRGFRLTYADDLRVSHPTRQDWPALRKKWLRLTSERQQMFGTGPRQRVIWGLRSGAVALYALKQIPMVLRYPGLSWQERRGALATLLRITGLRMVWMIRQSLWGGGAAA